MADSLFNNFVPEMWASRAFPSLKPLSLWIQELLDRLFFIQNWIDHGIPKVYWISGFFFPQAFLTGTLQNYARRRQISISTVSYVFKVLTGSHEDIPEAPPNGCYVYGLFVEGMLCFVLCSVIPDSDCFQARAGEVVLRVQTRTPLLIRNRNNCSLQWPPYGSNARKIASNPRPGFTIARATRFSPAKVPRCPALFSLYRLADASLQACFRPQVTARTLCSRWSCRPTRRRNIGYDTAPFCSSFISQPFRRQVKRGVALFCSLAY